MDADYDLAMRLVHDEAWVKQNCAIMEASITCVKDAPVLHEFIGKKIACFAPISSALTGAEDERHEVLSFADSFAAAFDGAKAVVTPLNEMTDEIRAEIAGDYDLAVVGLYHAGMREGQQKMLKAIIKTGKPVIVVMLGVPYDYTYAKEADAVLATYEYTPLSVEALICAMRKDRYEGSLPVNLD